MAVVLIDCERSPDRVGAQSPRRDGLAGAPGSRPEVLSPFADTTRAVNSPGTAGRVAPTEFSGFRPPPQARPSVGRKVRHGGGQ